MKRLLFVTFLFLGASSAFATEKCGKMETWDTGMAMCMPRAMEGMAMRMFMIRGNFFGSYISESGPRGRDAFAAPNMIMTDLGSSIGGNHYLNLDFMGTAEKWTLPKRGYPLLGQIGEHDENGYPFIDAQHPHSSPIMGLTLSDTINLGEESTLKITFAPRGEAGDGPIAFMHRATGTVNPDAPLGHHDGQDVGHISSTVISAEYSANGTRIAASAFNGEEPEPTKVDLPIGTPNSYALRISRDFSETQTAMISAAYVKNPEHDDPSLPFVARYSGSLYSKGTFGAWAFDNTLIFGLIQKYDHVRALYSIGEEFLLKDERMNSIFGRVELVQRTAAELETASASPNAAKAWIATTLGYTRALRKIDSAEIGLGGSVTHDFLPAEFRGAYAGDPWTGKVFLRLSGNAMWDL